MFTLMRRYRKGLRVGLLIVAAAFMVSLFYVGTRGVGDGSERDAIATVNGETIPVERYKRRYQSYMDTYAQIYKDKFTPELAERMGLPQQVVNDLVQEALVFQRARAEGLEVTDEELNAQIQAVPTFQEGGRFSMRRYQEYLRGRGMPASTFESDVRRELTRMKVESLVRSGVKVSDAEVERAFAQQRESVRAAWALVELAPLVAVAAATDEEVQTYLQQHSLEFRQPERRHVQYAIVNARDFVRPPPDADVQKYYEEHAKEFESPKQVKAAHVLVRVPQTGGSGAEDKAKAKVADVIRRARAGEPFAKLAKEISEDPGSAANGGDLGLVSAGELVPEFEKVAFSLKPGEISPEPVRTQFGYHAIQVSEVKAGGKKSFAEAAPQIRERLSADNAERAAKARADEIRPGLQAAQDFMAEAKKLGLTPIDTRISRTETPTGEARPNSMEEMAFNLSPGGVGAPAKTPAGYVIMKAFERMPAAVPPLAEIREQVATALKRQKAEAGALERAKQIAAEAKSGDVGAAGKKAGAVTGETAAFSRVKPAERIPGDAMHAALQTVTGGVTDPVKTPQGFYVLKVLERIPADTADLDKERDKITRELTTQKQGQLWESWIASARGTAKIDVSPRLMPARRG
ncbi:MAG: hypothetical protein DMD81_09525 [Candidatus Rokuibacteriota bacterium]|nr:MAG: hypothetical protein DMD81_09525 [Candidatus Rokubacteria bacterium]